LTQKIEGGAFARRASPEAIAMMMKNIKTNKGNNTKAWVPDRLQSVKKDS